MIHLVAGDILLTGAQVIAHGVAPKDSMTHGLSLALHQYFPSMHKDFHHWCNHTHAEPGAAWLWTSASGKRIVNLLTQEGSHGHGGFTGKATLKHVRDALKALHKMIETESFASIALPRLATGAGGLQWPDVLSLIQEQLGDSKIPVYVYAEYHAGRKAKEPSR
jgi:O-acetyl-ADP-ribose deacetylase (regulator of RNase III)